MSTLLSRIRLSALLALSIFLVVGCSDSPTESDHDEPEPVAAEIYERGTDVRLAYTHDDHWHGNFQLTVGEEVGIDVVFLDENDEVIPLGGEYTVRADIAPGQEEHVVHVEAHGDHLDVEAESVGVTGLIIHFWHDGHADWSTPMLPVTVVN